MPKLISMGDATAPAGGSVYTRFLRPILERALILLALPLAFPIMLAIAFAIRFTSGGPIFLRLSCKDETGAQFRQWRFRCLYQDAAMRRFLSTHSGRSEELVTPVGRFLIKTKLNTMPQIFNVLAGQTSLFSKIEPLRRA